MNEAERAALKAAHAEWLITVVDQELASSRLERACRVYLAAMRPQIEAEAFRRGAEAMREQCGSQAVTWGLKGTAKAILALPLPLPTDGADAMSRPAPTRAGLIEAMARQSHAEFCSSIRLDGRPLPWDDLNDEDKAAYRQTAGWHIDGAISYLAAMLPAMLQEAGQLARN